MWLVNIRVLQLEEFVEGSVPPYAILSHKWTDDELNFKEVFKKRANASKKGYKKLIKACEVTAAYELDYLWIDTCCIDKRSSAELSEAINSMFAWYKNATVCLAYLEDVKAGPGFGLTFKESVWFTRSWTLQELIAPARLDFYDSNWVHVGDKQSNADIIEEITGIDVDMLSTISGLAHYSIAERMSWAANRTATRTEDVAYSLMGIFGINMALLYGEGSGAFSRLQQQIIRQTEDQSFLFWGHVGSTHPEYRLLAESPKDFRGMSGQSMYISSDRQSIGITNVGLEIEALMVRMGHHLYGLVVADGDEQKHAVVVRKLQRANTFCKVGIAAMDSALVEWSRIRKVIILWGGERQLDHEKGLNNLTNEAGILGLAVEGDERYPIRAMKFRDHRRSAQVATQNSSCGTSCMITFDRPEHLEVAAAICRTSKTSVLTIYLSFDFDCSPYALVCNGNHAGLDPVVLGLLETPQFQSLLEKEQHDVMQNVKIHLGGDAYLFRSSSFSFMTIAKLPTEMTGEDYDVWFKFDPPPVNVLSSWKLKIWKTPDGFEVSEQIAAGRNGWNAALMARYLTIEEFMENPPKLSMDGFHSVRCSFDCDHTPWVPYGSPKQIRLSAVFSNAERSPVSQRSSRN